MGSRKLAIDILEKTGSAVLVCNGNSMRPLMKPKDTLFIKKVDCSLLRVGDAVFCRINGNLQVHKISAIDENQERWQISNARSFVNGWVKSSAIYGLCVKVEDKIVVSDEDLLKRSVCNV